MDILGNSFLSFVNHIIMPFMLPFLLMATLGTLAGAKTDKLMSTSFDLLEYFLGGVCRVIINALATIFGLFIPRSHKTRTTKKKDDSSDEESGTQPTRTRKPRTPKGEDGEQMLNKKQETQFCPYCNAYKEPDNTNSCISCAFPFLLKTR